MSDVTTAVLDVLSGDPSRMAHIHPDFVSAGGGAGATSFEIGI